MTSQPRPAQITDILKTIYSNENAEISEELESYIADLEAKQPVRPTRITEILKTLGSSYSAEIGIPLEAYLSKLEASQQTVDQNHPLTSKNPTSEPVWSHKRTVQRELHRRERALKKLNHYR